MRGLHHPNNLSSPAGRPLACMDHRVPPSCPPQKSYPLLAALPAGTGDSLIHTLPIDCLRTVFAHLPEKPSLLVISLVCKRWRDAVYSSIAHHRKEMSLALLQRLPCVTALDLSPRLIDYSALESLSPLKSVIITHEGGECCCPLLQRLPAAERLR